MPRSKSSSKAGRPADPESFRSRLERGEARNLKVTLPEELYKALRVQAALTDRPMSELVSEAVSDWLASLGDGE